MRSKLSVIQFSNCIGHIFFPYKLHDTSAISVNISITYITCFTHVILQILPASTWRQSRDNHSVFGSPGWGAIAASGSPAASTPAAASACTAAASRKLHPQTVSIVIIAVATIHRVFRVSAGPQKAKQGVRKRTWKSSSLSRGRAPPAHAQPAWKSPHAPHNRKGPSPTRKHARLPTTNYTSPPRLRFPLRDGGGLRRSTGPSHQQSHADSATYSTPAWAIDSVWPPT